MAERGFLFNARKHRMAVANYDPASAEVAQRIFEAVDVATGRMAAKASNLVRGSMPGPGSSATDSMNRGTGQNDSFTPSNIGSPPGVRMGTLQRSITFERVGPGKWAVATNLKYAAIHEYGGTINHPGGTPYIMTDTGPKFIKAETAARMKSEGKHVGLTRPHTINMPARPFFFPTIQSNRDTLVRTFIDNFKTVLTGG